MLDQIIASVTAALEADLPEIEDETWGIVDGRPAQTGTIKRRPTQYDVAIHSFPQTWSSSAIGFPGAGGQMMSTCQTVIVIQGPTAFVYFGGRFAYKVENCYAIDRFRQDMSNQNMASQMQSFKRYSTGEPKL